MSTELNGECFNCGCVATLTTFPDIPSTIHPDPTNKTRALCEICASTFCGHATDRFASEQLSYGETLILRSLAHIANLILASKTPQ